MAVIYKGAVGVSLRIDTYYPITSGTWNINIKMKKPDGTVLELTPTTEDKVNGRYYYTTDGTEIDQEGEYEIQVNVNKGDDSIILDGTIDTFNVREPLAVTL